MVVPSFPWKMVVTYDQHGQNTGCVRVETVSLTIPRETTFFTPLDYDLHRSYAAMKNK